MFSSCKKEGRVVDGDYEPPAPHFWEEYDDESVEGVDADNDGLRDDIERKINDLADTPNRRKAFKQYFKTLYEAQKYAVYIDHMEKSKKKFHELGYDRSCVAFYYLNSKGRKLDDFYDIKDKIYRLLKNSTERKRVYKNADKNLAGGVFRLHPEDKKNCKFEIDNK